VFAVHASLVGGDFAQREALFVAAWLPLVCSGAAAARGVELPVAGSVALAVFAALGIAFKPFFAPIWIAAELVFALHAGRRALLMRRENVTLGGLLMGYGLYVVYLTPYLDHLGEWVGPYSAYDLPLAVLLWRSSPAFLVAVVVAGAIWRLPLARDSVAPLDLAMLAATLPAMASVLVQAKGFSYHAWPLNALVALVLVLLVLGREPREATLRRPSFSTLLGVSGLLLLLLSSVVGRFPLLQPAAFAMTALAFLAGPGAEGDSPGAVTAKPPAGSRQPATHWAAPSTWVLVASLLTLGASRAALSWIPSVRATFDEYTCQSIPYAQSRQTCSYAALLSALRPHVAPGDGVLWVTSDSIPASVVMMELGLRAVARETFMRVPHAYARRNDPRIRYPYHSPEQALGDEQQVRDSFVSSVVASMPKLVIFDRRADAIAFGAVPFDAEAWFRADPAGAACLDASYVPLDIGAATRGTHVAYVRRD
jgi:hypothetical protein